jgi:CheY-like chemotaxis protein
MSKILVVEDTDAIAELIFMVLKARGYELARDPSGSQAFTMAKSFRPDLILLDVTLPGLDGYQIQSQLMEDEETRKIPIIVMTSKLEMEEVFQTASNVVGFLSKPFNIQALVERVRSAIK